MLVRLRCAGGANRNASEQALGETLEFEKSGRAVVFRVNSRGEMRDFAVRMNRAANFKQPKLIEMAGVILDVLPDTRQETGAQQILIRHDGIGHLYVGR